MFASEITYLWYSFQQYDSYRFYDYFNNSCSSFWISNEWKCLCFYRDMVTYDGFYVFDWTFGGKPMSYNKIYECCNKPFVFSDVVIFRSNDSGRSISGWSSRCNQMDAAGNWNWYIKKGVHWLLWWYNECKRVNMLAWLTNDEFDRDRFCHDILRSVIILLVIAVICTSVAVKTFRWEWCDENVWRTWNVWRSR